jgi:hypothetical protein
VLLLCIQVHDIIQSKGVVGELAFPGAERLSLGILCVTLHRRAS